MDTPTTAPPPSLPRDSWHENTHSLTESHTHTHTQMKRDINTYITATADAYGRAKTWKHVHHRAADITPDGDVEENSDGTSKNVGSLRTFVFVLLREYSQRKGRVFLLQFFKA